MITLKIELKVIAQKIDEGMAGWETYYNPKNGKMIDLPDDADYMDEETEALAREVEENGDFLRLPNQYEIHEYRIMQEFAIELDNETLQGELLKALTRKHSYRNFKDAIKYYGIADLYYKYRLKKCYELAKMWCRNNSLDYIEQE